MVVDCKDVCFASWESLYLSWFYRRLDTLFLSGVLLRPVSGMSKQKVIVQDDNMKLHFFYFLKLEMHFFETFF